MKIVLVHESSKSLRDLRVRFVVISLESYIRCKIILTVFVSGMLEMRDITSNDTNKKPSSNNLLGILLICETTSKLSLIVNSLVVKGFKRLVRYLVTGW